MTDQRPSDVVRAWFDRVWNKQEERAIYELFPPRGEAHGLGAEPLIGPGAFHQFWIQLTHTFRELHVEILDTIDEGARCHVRCRATVEFRGARIEFEGAVQCEVRGGQILHAWNYWDFLSLMAGMGSIATDAFPLALAGKRFA